jgi:hypothetical protein
MLLTVYFFKDAFGLELKSKLRMERISRNVTNVHFCFFFREASELELEGKLRVRG